ncbi:DUF4240 domain-containing protein [Cryptosporangium minutisporangium]|uniref:DUF4240 domain-containing protein n=1 Tax=Cryptosporangium minutisporangium TaxID=113569 RepID=A0ABP6TEC9_9ACTN
MTEEEFWALVGQLGGAVTEESVEHLTTALAARSEAAIIGFADQLAAALYRLDTPPHADRDLLDPESGQSMGMSDDSFLYARAGTVAAGRAVYERAVADPAALRTSLEDLNGEFLLQVAPEAWDRATGLAWDHETPVSYETGSNWPAWGKTAPVEAEPYRAPWFRLGIYHGLDARRVTAQVRALFACDDAIRKDAAWQAWWEHAGTPELELNMYYGFETEGVKPPRVRRAKHRAQADVYFGSERITAPTKDMLRAQVEKDVLLVLGLVRDKFGLPPLPPLPR